MGNILLVLGSFLVLILLYAIFIYNRFISVGRRRDEAWSGILVQLKKRHDLVPNLVESVKAYATHEKTLLEDLAARRSMLGGASSAELAKDESVFSSLLGRVIALSEAYPELKASSNFIALQNSLAESEEAIQMARRYYNGLVRDYNILVESFPSLIIAAIFKFKLSNFFELDDPAEAKVPQVKF